MPTKAGCLRNTQTTRHQQKKRRQRDSEAVLHARWLFRLQGRQGKQPTHRHGTRALYPPPPDGGRCNLLRREPTELDTAGDDFLLLNQRVWCMDNPTCVRFVAPVAHPIGSLALRHTRMRPVESVPPPAAHHPRHWRVVTRDEAPTGRPRDDSDGRNAVGSAAAPHDRSQEGLAGLAGLTDTPAATCDAAEIRKCKSSPRCLWPS